VLDSQTAARFARCLFAALRETDRMKPEVSNVTKAIEELMSLLRRFDERHWSTKIEDDLFFLRKGDIYGAKRFLTYFGGMGSLNDVWLCAANGHSVSDEMEQKVNTEFDALKSQAWALANEITKGVNKPLKDPRD
jgi:hypothetical protein